MDYYEELGISRTANEEEIRRAHRRMTKLLHPDQQTDEGLKQLAEVQMRRLNMIVDVLLDSERRADYDEQLHEDGPYVLGAGVGQGKRTRRKRPSWPWWIASTAAAIALTLVVVWLWADNLGSSFGNHSPTYIPSDSKETPASAAEVSAPPSQPETPSVQIPDKSVKAPVSATPVPNPPTVVKAALPSQTLAKVPVPATPQASAAPDLPRPAPSHKTLVLPPAQITAQAHPMHVDLPPPPGLPLPGTQRVDAAALPIAPLPATPLRPPPESQPPTKDVSFTAGGRSTAADLLEGEWVYAPTQPEKKKVGFYPPEFIDLKLVRDEGGLRGQYHARYQISDKPISPDVEFALSPDGEQNKFIWQASNGSKGTFKISAIDPNVIRVEWRTTVFSHKPALTAGTATLVKRGE